MFFENFQIDEILAYHRLDDLTKNIFLPILESYYKKHLLNASFTNCLWEEGDIFYSSNLEVRLGLIFKIFQFQTEEKYLIEFLWLSNEGVLEYTYDNKSKTFFQLILNSLSENGLLCFKNKIIQNFKTGIKSESVLKTHILAVKRLRITEAKLDLLECAKSKFYSTSLKCEAIETYCDLSKDVSAVLDILFDFNSLDEYFIYFLILKLYKDYPIEISSISNQLLEGILVSEEYKVKISQILADIGVWKGFAFLVNQIRISKKSPVFIQGRFNVKKIETEKALNEIEDIIYLIIDSKQNNFISFHDSAKHILFEWLKSFSNKSEEDLVLVMGFIEKCRDNLIKNHSNANDLNWYINFILEDFRNSDKSYFNVNATKLKLQEVFHFN